MKKPYIAALSTLILLLGACAEKEEAVPADGRDGFVDIEEVIPSVQLDIRYYSNDNFVGSRIDGYSVPKCFLTKEAAAALEGVQEELVRDGRSLKIFDCYRPQRAVDHFVRWAKDLNDTRMKSRYYPSVDKKNLFRDGYIAAQSGHSRGSTLDLIIVDMNTDQELDMGSGFDYFDPISHTINNRITAPQQDNRIALKSVMENHGFKNLPEEWWHFTLEKEPYPDTYFDFKVE